MTATTQASQAAKLTPVDCGKDDTAVLEAAFDGQRKRPVVAIDRQGHKVVCCLRTAKKNGWKIEGRLFNKPSKVTKPVKVEEVKAELVKPATKKAPAKKAEPSTLTKLNAEVAKAGKTKPKKADPLLG
jgi:hypothetical protein